MQSGNAYLKQGVCKTILNIKSDAQVSCSNDDDIDNCELTWHYGNPTNITKEQIKAKMQETQYKQDRVEAYPSWQEQMDMQYHDLFNGTTTWKDAIQAVKDAHPQP